MYLRYFSLHAKPFELLPDPGFLFLSAAHKKALAHLEYGLRELPGFVLVTGEVGAGKTTLIRAMLRQRRTDTIIATVFNTKVSADQLVRMVLDDFGVEVPDAPSGAASGYPADKADMLRRLNMFLIEQYAAGRHSVLIVDEAQNLSPDVLEEVRLLSNLETDNAKLLHIILVGQPELRDKLRGPDMAQLRQRILVYCHVPPLDPEETESYILHRLEQAGNRDALDWQDGCFHIIHAAGRGIPRLINILCDYILLDAFSANRREVSPDNLRDLLAQLDFEAQFWPEQPAPAPESASAAGSGFAPERMRLLEEHVDVLRAAVAGLVRHLDKPEQNEIDDILQRLATLEKNMRRLAGAQHKLRRVLGSSHARLAAGQQPERAGAKPH